MDTHTLTHTDRQTAGIFFLTFRAGEVGGGEGGKMGLWQQTEADASAPRL